MIITGIICATIVACILILSIFTDRISKIEVDSNELLNELNRDIDEIFYIAKTIDLDSVYVSEKDKIMHITRIAGSYSEEVNNIVENVVNESSKES